MRPVIVDGVSRRFGNFVAVDAVSMGVSAGEVLALVGPNGAGKTTLIRMILGLLAPTSGRLALFGADPSREARRRVGYVPQNLGLYRDLTGKENLEFRAACFGSSPEEGPTGLDGAGLTGAMPLGHQRNLAFLAATGHSPDLLILDEPTSGVSPLARAHMWDRIRGEAARGAAVLVSTHYMEEAEQADRLVLLSSGALVAEGSLGDIVGERMVIEVDSDRWRDVFSLLDGDGRFVMLDGRKIRVIGDSQEAVLGRLVAAGLDTKVRSVPASLDETLVVVSR